MPNPAVPMDSPYAPMGQGNPPAEMDNSPASAPTPALGIAEMAKLNIAIAMKLLESSIPQLSDPEEKQSLMEATLKLAKKFGGSKDKNLTDLQLQHLMNTQGDQTNANPPQPPPAAGAEGGVMPPQGGMPPGPETQTQGLTPSFFTGG